MNDKPNLGECLKALRQDRHWTLAQVSQLSGLAISTISKVENNQMSLTYDKLLQLSRGLGVEISELFMQRKPSGSPTTNGGARAINRHGDGRTAETPNYLYQFLCTEMSRKEMIPMVATVLQESIGSFGPMIRHPGQEFVYVIEGAIELHSDVYEPLRLEAGESVYFESMMGHAYIRVGSSPARILCICTAAFPESAGGQQRGEEACTMVPSVSELPLS